MRIIISFIFCFILSYNSYTQVFQDSLFNELDVLILRKKQYDDEKEKYCLSLRDSLKGNSTKERLANRLDILLSSVKAYESYKYDSAFYYASQANKLAFSLNNRKKIMQSKVSLSYILLFRGLYSSVIDTLKTVDASLLNNTERLDYYNCFYRTYYDLGVYAKDAYFTPLYKSEGHKYCRKIFNEAKPQSQQFLLAKSLFYLAHNDYLSSLKYYTLLVKTPNLSFSQKAAANFGLGFCYKMLNDNSKAKEFLIQAAINDILSSTKETAALRVLAEILYEQGEYDLAYKYISISKESADFYGAEQRKLEISYVMPLIEKARWEKSEYKKRITMIYMVLLFILLLLIISFGLVLVKQLKKIRKAKLSIQNSNIELKKLNKSLNEANIIKEEYIGFYFNSTSKYIDQIGEIKNNIQHLLIAKKYNQIDILLGGMQLKKEREQFFDHFDSIFLKLFPNFINDFNLLFSKENQSHVKAGKLLNTNLRIFALIRLGVTDNEQIAKILNFSVNTIYTYKTKIKNNSLVENELFEDKILKIPSI